MIKLSEEEIEVRELSVSVGTKSWTLSIRKSEGDKEPRIIFFGQPTVSDFAKAFKKLAETDIVMLAKDAVEKIAKQLME